MVISGKYEVVGILGQGGMGVVYKVRHTDLRTYLAVKVLPLEAAKDKEFVERFREEALKTYQLSNPHKRHPNIVQIQDVDFDESLNSYYYLMEYIQGKTVAQYLKEQGPFPLPRILTIGRKVGEALAYAHNQPRPVIHRDISPSNIMIEDRSERVVVMDFGIAKELGEQDRTKGGVVIGKPQYCSPEQIKHEPLSGASDIYSLGMVVYEMYTGQQFFAGLQPEEVADRVLDRDFLEVGSDGLAERAAFFQIGEDEGKREGQKADHHDCRDDLALEAVGPTPEFHFGNIAGSVKCPFSFSVLRMSSRGNAPWV